MKLFVEFVKLNLKMKFVWKFVLKLDNVLFRYVGLNIDFIINFKFVVLVWKIVLSLKWK